MSRSRAPTNGGVSIAFHTDTSDLDAALAKIREGMEDLAKTKVRVCGADGTEVGAYNIRPEIAISVNGISLIGAKPARARGKKR